MASPHAVVVTGVDNRGHGHVNGRPSDSSTPIPSDAEAGVGEISRERLAPPSRLHSPVRTHSPDSWLGYESPNEENATTYFADHQTQTSPGATATGHSQNSTSRPLRRPALVSRPSHMVAIQPPNQRANTGSSLNNMLSGAEKSRPGAKVSIKDRIACYQWTWFTMVCYPPFRAHHQLTLADHGNGRCRQCTVFMYVFLSVLTEKTTSNICSALPCHLVAGNWPFLLHPQHLSLHHELCFNILPLLPSTGQLHALLHRPG